MVDLDGGPARGRLGRRGRRGRLGRGRGREVQRVGAAGVDLGGAEDRPACKKLNMDFVGI